MIVQEPQALTREMIIAKHREPIDKKPLSTPFLSSQQIPKIAARILLRIALHTMLAIDIEGLTFPLFE